MRVDYNTTMLFFTSRSLSLRVQILGGQSRFVEVCKHLASHDKTVTNVRDVDPVREMYIILGTDVDVPGNCNPKLFRNQHFIFLE